MKKKIVTCLKIVFIILIIAWMILFVKDYFQARNGIKPTICLSEKTITKDNNTYYRCVSLGYKYYEYKESSQTTYGFGAAFLKNEIEKKIED